MPELTLYEALAGLFTSAFVSATLFPGASEAVLLALVHAWPDEITIGRASCRERVDSFTRKAF